MNFKAFFVKNWQHFASIIFIFIVVAVFYQPQMDGNRLAQHDIEQWQGMSNEVNNFRDATGEEAFWTNSMFGGMPATQISVQYPNNHLGNIRSWYYAHFQGASGLLILHLIGFYIFALFMRMNPLVGLLGGIAFSFASYEIIIVQAGHVAKSSATAFMAPILGAIIYSYRDRRVLGMMFFALFMSYELISNHFQITYYLMFPVLAVCIYLFVEAYQNKKLKSFFITSGGLVVALICALAVNAGNLMMTSDYSQHTIRGENDLSVQANGQIATGSENGGLDKEYITQWSYGIGESFTLVSPNIKGAGSFAIGGSQFEEIVDDSEFTISEQARLKKMGAYWGEQPFTSGPTYLGVVVVLFAILALFFSSNKIKWPLFAVTVLALFLSWGKNLMWFSDLFIDHFPMYDKFRVVAMTLVLVEFCVAILAMLFIVELFKSREKLLAKKNQVLIVGGGFFVLLLLVKVIGLGDNYTTSKDELQISNIEASFTKQIRGADPKQMMDTYQIDINNPQQVQKFVEAQIEPYQADFTNLRSIRSDIFHSSMNRSLVFVFFTLGIILLYLFTSIPVWAVAGGALLITMVDLIPIAYEYIGDEEKYWIAAEDREFSVSANAGDEEILQAEIAADPNLREKIGNAKKKGQSFLAERDDIESLSAQRNVINKFRFEALNMNTSYRVFDLDGGFNSSRSSYFHKAIGGYHGAKLRNIANLIDFHLGSMNEDVYDMLNTKYFIQTDGNGVVRSIPRPGAMGNAWLVKEIETHETAIQEIKALGNKFELNNLGSGSLLVGGKPMQKSIVYGAERIQYLMPSGDSVDIQLRPGLKVGEEAVFVSDVNGNMNYIPAFALLQDTLNSFIKHASYKVLNEFVPQQEAVMLKSEADKLSSKSFTGEGTVTMDEYKPNKLTYTADVEGKQFVVFSEIFYPDWKAYIDGKEVEILKTNYLLRGLEVPAGKHKIEFVITNPTYDKAHLLTSIFSIIILGSFVVYIGFAIRNKIKEGKTTEENAKAIEE